MKLSYNTLTILWCFAWMGILFAAGLDLAFRTNALLGSIVCIVGSVVLAFLGKIHVPSLRGPGETKRSWIWQSLRVLIAAVALVPTGVVSLWMNTHIVDRLPSSFFLGWWAMPFAIVAGTAQLAVLIVLFVVICTRLERMLGIPQT